MDTKFNYSIVGLFVIILSLAFLVVALWLSVGLGKKDYDTYQIYMSESVSGLSVNAPVKYNGVDVGVVKSIALRPKDPKQVSIVVSIEDDTPVTVHTYATLMSQGLTGISYIELKNTGTETLSLNSVDDSPYPVIASKPSLLYRLDTAVDMMTKNIGNVGNMGKLFDNLLDSNTQKNIKQTITNLATLTTNLAQSSSQLQSLISHATIVLNNAATASKALPETLAHINKSTQALTKASTASQLMIQQVNTQVLPSALNTLTQLEHLLLRLRLLTQSLAQNPSMLLRGKAQASAGPGESP